MVLFYTPSTSPVISRYSGLVATLKLSRFFEPLHTLRVYRPDGYLYMTKNSDVETSGLELLVRELPYAVVLEPREIVFMTFRPIPDEFYKVRDAVEGRTFEVHWHDKMEYYHELVLSEPLMKETLYGYDVRYEDRPDPVYDEGTIETPVEVNVILAGFKGEADKNTVISDVVARLVELYGIKDFSVEENFTSVTPKLESGQ